MTGSVGCVGSVEPLSAAASVAALLAGDCWPANDTSRTGNAALRPSQTVHPRTSTSTRPVPTESALTMTAAAPETAIVLTVEEAARRLGIGRTLMYALVMAGDVESVSIGRLRRVPADALTDYVNRLRGIDPTGEAA